MHIRLFCLLAFLGLAASCNTYKNFAYFKDMPDSGREVLPTAHYQQLRIRTDDILSITVETMDPTANVIFSTPTAMSTPAMPLSPGSSSSAGTPAGTVTTGTGGATYLVDRRGEIQMPLLGNMHVEGLTTMDARDTIQRRAALYYNNPAVYVRFGNLKVTVLGEVAHPGTYILPGEKNTILDALGLSGDLTVYGKRENVLLIRDSAGYNEMIRFNMLTKKVLTEDIYYLRQNDVVYVEPNKSKLSSQDAVKNRNFAILASVLTIIIALIARI